MKRTIALTLILSAACFGVAACGGDDDDGGSSSGSVEFKVPDGVSRKLPACSSASRMVDSAGATFCTNCAPASDSETLRVVRLKSRTPMRASSPAIE